MTETASSLPMQMTLGDVARLAKVQRPVVSVWRGRSAATAAPFPEPFATVRGEERFDADAVVGWLERTGRGKNPKPREDVASFASPTGMSAQDDEVVFNGLAALLCLKEISGERLASVTVDDLLDLADEADPDDEFLMSEISALGPRLRPLSRYADTLAEASYTCTEAFEQLIRTRRRSSAHPTVALRQCANDLVASLAEALAVDAGLEPAVYVDPTCGGSDLLVSLVRRGDEAGSATVLIAAHRDAASRQARRRLRVHGVRCEPLAVDDDGAWAVARPAVHLAQYPSPGYPAMSATDILSALDHLVLQMDDGHRAVAIAAASVLSDRIRDRREDELRDALLRCGRVRAIVRLPKGLVVSKPRQALALWVLGPAHGIVPLEDRRTMVADLTDVEPADLDQGSAAIGDLVSDLVVAMADRSTVRSHAFRFVRPALTRDLLAGGGDLVARRPGVLRPPRIPGSEIAVRIAELTAALSSADAVAPPVCAGIEARDTVEGSPPPLTLGEAIAARQVRMIAGNRMDREDLSGGTVRVIGPEELTGAIRSGARGVDRLAFSATYPAGRYTEPGDVVFCTSPRPAALVDVEGGSVVLAPTRVLRITPASGLLPEVLAGDINAVPAEARTWRGWTIRRVPPAERVALADALAAIERQRIHALNRVALLGELTQLVMRGVTSGSLTLTAGIDSVEGH
ncbi:MAG: hypothetical protein ACRDSP_02980 [Pseudonocardiaceae bacterium]